MRNIVCDRYNEKNSGFLRNKVSSKNEITLHFYSKLSTGDLIILYNILRYFFTALFIMHFVLIPEISSKKKKLIMSAKFFGCGRGGRGGAEKK